MTSTRAPDGFRICVVALSEVGCGGWTCVSLSISNDGDFVTIDGTLFTICPWWDGPQTQQEVGAQLARDAERPKNRWVWVYHAPPDQSPTSWGGQTHFGDTALVRWIKQYNPDIVLTGHIHQSPFRQGGSWVDRLGSTWVFNPGRQIGPRPTHILFDTDEQLALWFSLAGAEVVRLDQPLRRPVPELTELPAWFKGSWSDRGRSPGRTLRPVDERGIRAPHRPCRDGPPDPQTDF
jgi:hypothetical protein